MKLKVNRTYFFMAIFIFLIEIVIALSLKQGFIRHTFGDFLVVILMYCALRSFIKTKPIYLALVVLLIAFCVEFLQKTKFLEWLNLEYNAIAKLVLGSTFQYNDLIAYTLGVLVIIFVEYKLRS